MTLQELPFASVPKSSDESSLHASKNADAANITIPF
jgi:hypothetical protein